MWRGSRPLRWQHRGNDCGPRKNCPGRGRRVTKSLRPSATHKYTESGRLGAEPGPCQGYAGEGMRPLSGKALIGGLAAFWFLVGGACGAPADQKDARLPALFDQLKAAPDIEAAAAVEAQIWAIWLQANDQAIDTLMTEGNEAMEAQKFGTAL